MSESGVRILSQLSPALIWATCPCGSGLLPSLSQTPLPLASAQAWSRNLGLEDEGGDVLTQLWIPWSLLGRPGGALSPRVLGARACSGLGPEPAQLPVWLREEVSWVTSPEVGPCPHPLRENQASCLLALPRDGWAMGDSEAGPRVPSCQARPGQVWSLLSHPSLPLSVQPMIQFA